MISPGWVTRSSVVSSASAVAALSPHILPCGMPKNGVAIDGAMVRGTHGWLYGGAAAGPVFLCSDRKLARDRVAATDVKELCLRVLAGAAS